MPRGLVEGLEVPAPFGELLPTVYWDDPFTQELTRAFDAVMAPIYSTVDCVDAYFDPWLAPPDFLEWVGSWLGLVFDETLPLERRRRLVAEAARLYRSRGTIAGLTEHIALFTGVNVEIEDSGGADISEVPGGTPPGEEVPSFVVRLVVGRGERVNVDRVREIVRLSAPAHVPYEVAVVRR